MHRSKIGPLLCVLAGGCAVTPAQILDRESSTVRAAVPNGTNLDVAQERMEHLGYKCALTVADGPGTMWTSFLTCSRRVESGIPRCAVDVEVKSSHSQTHVEGLQIWAPQSCQ